MESGNSILQSSGWDGENYRRFPPSDKYLGFRTEAMNLVRRSCGIDSEHYKELQRVADDKDGKNSYYFVNCLGILQAAKNDFDGGMLFDVKSLIAADVIGDFIDQAEQLLEAGYHIPAASLAGAVLEDTLRKLCEKHALSLPDITKIDRLNADLARANIYNKLVQKRITAIADVRNNADHGHFSNFSRDDVEDMVKWTRRFITNYLT